MVVEVDVSFSALYLHEMHHRMSVGGVSSASQTGARAANHRLPSEPDNRRVSLNELDEESLPLVDPGSPRLANSNLA